MIGALAEGVAHALERERVPGAALAILAEGQVEAAAWGVSSVEQPLPVTPETLFQVGSITKTVTATAAVRLAAAGRLSLDAPVRDVLPGLRLADEQAARTLTARHLLTHTAGLAGDWYIDSGSGDDALERAVARLDELEQVTPPGRWYSYCNPGFLLLGRMIEVIEGRPFHEAARDLVLGPAGLERSGFQPVAAMTERFAAGHSVWPERIEVVRPWAPQRMMTPAGGLISCVTDLVAYARHHLDDPALGAMREPQVETGGGSDAVGLAWVLRDVGGTLVVSHGGDMRGQAALLAIVPERGAALAMTANAQTGHAVIAETQRAWLARLGLERPAPVPRDLPLAEYAGRYLARISDMDLEPDGDALRVGTTLRPLMPGSLTRFPDPAPSVVRAYAPDRLVGIAGPLTGACLEILRDPDGSVAWLRSGGRVRRRVGTPGSDQAAAHLG